MSTVVNHELISNYALLSSLGQQTVTGSFIGLRSNHVTFVKAAP